MQSASIEFPLLQKPTPFGLICDPRIPLVVRSPAGDLNYRFLVDTGADISVAPRYIAEMAGLDWNILESATFMGVGSGAMSARVGELALRIADIEVNVRCLFVDMASDLYVLGHADFLDRFALAIDTRAQLVRLTAYE
jgi:predicted aspartyl protease